MEPFENLLFPVDLSETSPKLVPYVRLMAERFGARIHLLFVARVFDYFKGIYVPHPSIHKFEQEIVEGASKRLEEFRQEHFAAADDIRTGVRAGDISEELLGYIASEGIDVVVMGTHGRQGIDKVMFGSVAERLIRVAPVPVLLINPYKVKGEAARPGGKA